MWFSRIYGSYTVLDTTQTLERGAVIEDRREKGMFNLATARLIVGEYRHGEVLLLARISAASDTRFIHRLY